MVMEEISEVMFYIFQPIEVYVNPLMLKLIEIIFNSSVRTAKKTQHFYITKIIIVVVCMD
jgi:hypothetical protein